MSGQPNASDRRLALLRQLVAADDAASDVFFTASSQQATTLFHDGLPSRQIECDLGDVQALYADGFLVVTEFRRGGDMLFSLRTKAHDLVRSRDAALSDWGEQMTGPLEDRLEGLREELIKARKVDDYQDVGRRTREILIDLAREVFDESMVPAGQETPGISDAKRMLDMFFDARLPGPANAEMRQLMRAANGLAQSVAHAGTVTAIHAFAAAQAAVLITRVAQTAARESQPPGADSSP